jgi:hypothetical protein
MDKIYIRKNENNLKAVMQVNVMLGTVTVQQDSKDKSFPLITYEGVMNLMEIAVQNELEKLASHHRPANSYEIQHAFETIRDSFQEYFKAKMALDFGVKYPALTLKPDGTLDGVFKDLQYEVVREDV